MRVLSAVVLCIQLAVVLGVNPTTTTKKPTTTKPPNCAGMNFEKMGKCCSEPPVAFINITKKDKTCGISTSNIKVFNMYILNKQQSLKKGWNNTVPFNDTKIGKSLYPLAYFADCWLRAKGVVGIHIFKECNSIEGLNPKIDNDTGIIDGSKMETFIAANQSEKWAPVLREITAMCVQGAKDMPAPLFVRDRKSNVSSAAFITAQCLAHISIEYCENRLNTTSCAKNYKMYDACKSYVYPYVIKPVTSKYESAPIQVAGITV